MYATKRHCGHKSPQIASNAKLKNFDDGPGLPEWAYGPFQVHREIIPAALEDAMTLLLTECSQSGVVMAADSAISMRRGAKTVTVDQKGWKKVLWVPKIRAAVGYWGDIGRVHSNRRFDEWLENEIQRAEYHDLPSLASALANILNNACHHRPLADNQVVGLHVAGFHPWEDAIPRPFFFHVHNGHGDMVIKEHRRPDGTRTKIEPEPRSDPRKLFEAHQEFPNVNSTLHQNLDVLKNGQYLTTNGDFFYYKVMSLALEQTFAYLNLIDGFKIPRDNSLGARRGLMIAAIQTIIRLYKCSNQSRTVGGRVVAISISKDRHTIDDVGC